MGDRREYDRSERYREGGELVECSHCNGTGTTTNYCCFKAAGGEDNGTPCAGYSPHRCCACGGSGRQRV